MFSSPLNTNIGQAIDRGYLKSLDDENINGYKCYQFYSIDYPWKDAPKPLFPFGSKTKECRPLNIKLYVKDGIDMLLKRFLARTKKRIKILNFSKRV